MSKNMPPMRGNDFDQGLRLGIQAALGNSGFDAESRDRYEVFGWPEDPDEEDYVALYLRNGYAKTVVDKPAFTTWRDTPKVKDRQETDSDTQFEREVKALARQKRIWAYCERGDRVAGVLNHGLLLLGFQDVVGDESGDSWEQPLWESDNDSLDDLNNLKPIVQTQIDDIDWGDVGSERWEKPEYYHLDLSDDIDEQSEGEGSIYRVHWSRVIDIPATRPFDDDTIARSRLEPVLNNLIDIEKTRGSAAEQSYRGADYGLHINYDPTKVDPDAVEDSNVGEEFQNWYHGLQPQFTTVGGEVNQLGGEMQDPGPIIEENVNEMASQTGIPKREFRGNQQGEQAGAEQDEKSYFGMISERREQYANPHIIRKFIDRLLRGEILTQPTGDGYLIEWPDLTQLSEAEEASLEADRSSVISNLFQAGIVLDREDAIQIVRDGEYPSFEQTANVTFDESDPRVQEQFQKQLGNATRYSEGDVVQTPQGIGVVAEVRTEAFEGKSDDEIPASSNSPTYVVGLKDERVGVGFYKASELSEGELPETETTPVEDIKEQEQSGNIRANQWNMPESWRESDTPARVILLKAWAGMGGQFDCGGSCCKGEMMGSGMGENAANQFCASMKDAVMGGWEGWRKGG